MTRLRVGDIVATPGNDGWWGTMRQVVELTTYGYLFKIISAGYRDAESPCSFDRCVVKLDEGHWRIMHTYPAYLALPQGA